MDCVKCGKPVIQGVGGYAGPQCMCWASPAPTGPLLDVTGTLMQQSMEITRLRAELETKRDGWHQANGVAELAMKHRDEAEAECERLSSMLDHRRDEEIETERMLRAELRNALLCAEVFKADAANLRRVLAALVDDIYGLIGESSGVYGLHQNGDPSPWEELLEGGAFSRIHLGEARAAVDRLCPATANEILSDAQRLIERAQHAGVVLTIETVSIPPWAMGRYAMRAATRPARGKVV